MNDVQVGAWSGFPKASGLYEYVMRVMSTGAEEKKELILELEVQWGVLVAFVCLTRLVIEESRCSRRPIRLSYIYT